MGVQFQRLRRFGRQLHGSAEGLVQGLKDEFIGNEDVEAMVEKQTESLNEWIADHSEDNSDDKPGARSVMSSDSGRIGGDVRICY